MISFLKNLSTDHYPFKSRLSSEEIKQRLVKTATNIKTNLRHATTHDFIGTLLEDGFSITDTAEPLGRACVMNGEIKGSNELILSTTLHKGFRILFTCFLALLGIFYVLFVSFNFSFVSFFLFIPLLVAATMFRLMLHGVYVMSRNNSVPKLKKVLELY